MVERLSWRGSIGPELEQFPVDELFEFINELRYDYKIGVCECIAVQTLLVSLAQRQGLPPRPDELEGYLRPILCSSPDEQRDFTLRYRDWLRGLGSSKVAPAPPEPSPPTPRDSLNTLRSRRRHLNWAIGVAIALGLGLVAWWGYVKWPTPSDTLVGPVASSPPPTGSAQPLNVNVPAAPNPQVGASQGLTESLAAALLLLGLALWFRQRLWGRRVDAYLVRANHDPTACTHRLYEQPSPQDSASVGLRQTARALRQRRPSEFTDLDVHATVAATAVNGGRFVAVRKARSVAPDYLMLVQRSSPHDLQCAWFVQILSALRAEDVFISVYFFEHDPCVLFAFGDNERPCSLGDLRSAYPNHQVGIFSDTEPFFNPFNSQPQPWIAVLLEWQQVCVFTPEVEGNWGRREALLSELGLCVLPATEQGLSASTHARWSEPARRSPPTPLLPLSIEEQPERWLSPNAPRSKLLDRCIDELQYYLGSAGFEWLAACAMYPQLRFPIAMNLATRLTKGEAGGQPNADTLRRLLRLPWCRRAYIPDWFRTRLLDRVDRRAHQRIRAELQAMLLSSPEEGATALQVSRAQRGILARVFRRALASWRKSEGSRELLEDRVFIRAMDDGFGMRLPRRLRHTHGALVWSNAGYRSPQSAIRQLWGAILLGAALGQGLEWSRIAGLQPALFAMGSLLAGFRTLSEQSERTLRRRCLLGTLAFCATWSVTVLTPSPILWVALALLGGALAVFRSRPLNGLAWLAGVVVTTTSLAYVFPDSEVGGVSRMTFLSSLTAYLATCVLFAIARWRVPGLLNAMQVTFRVCDRVALDRVLPDMPRAWFGRAKEERPRRASGCSVSLIGLMIVVSAIGVLAALAIYGVRKYVANAKTAEARMALGRMAKDAAAAFNRESLSGSELQTNRLCPSAPPVPSDLSAIRGRKYQSSPSDWNAPGWACLKFSMVDPQYFMYDYTVTGTKGVAGEKFTVRARGDLNGDGVLSTFTLSGEVVQAGESLVVVIAPAIQETNPDE